MDIYNLVSFGGLLVLVGMAWALSTNRRNVNWRCLTGGIVLQLAFGALVFLTPGSRSVFRWLNDNVTKVLDATKEGQWFVFGQLSLKPGEVGPHGEPSLGFFLVFSALPLAIVFSALMALLYHWGIMQWIIRGFARVFTRMMRVSGAESMCAASNIFVGIESATTIRPYLSRMTRSELCTVLTVGMATIASTVLAFYVDILNATFEGIAGHLISASILSAPAAILMSKLLMPEEGTPVTLGKQISLEVEREPSVMSAIISGSTAGLKLVVGIVALLIAVLGLLGIINLLLGGLGHLISDDLVLSLERLLGYVMYPFAVLIGVPPEDAVAVGEMLGLRLVATEVPAYFDLATAMGDGAFTHPRTAVVTAYALCGFAHVASLAIFVGGIAALVPERRKDLATVGPRALLAATLACLMTGAVAGTFFHSGLAALQNAGP